MRGKFSKNTSGPARTAERGKLYLRTKNSALRSVLPVLFLLVASACFDQGDCLITNTNRAKVAILGFTSKQPVPVTFSSISILGDSVLYQNAALSTLELPLNPDTTQMTFVFQTAAKSDTIVLHYFNQSIVLSPSCGAFTYQQDLAIWQHTFGADSAVVVNQILLKSVNENLRLYY